ncbi:MAG: InlB B-repeat-containing protein [Tannerella sp.]|jgi:uncharacterized repeat protein (TIGR02543 family)|nr:InlB B-repeat-containing protein [Tannerella sp.]
MKENDFIECYRPAKAVQIERKTNKRQKGLRFFFMMCMVCISSSGIFGQTAQVINETGGYTYIDGLKVTVNLNGSLSVYRNDFAQYCCNNKWPNGQGNGVLLSFRFSQGNTYNATSKPFEICSTTPVQKNGNIYTTSITGFVTSPFSGADVFYITMNVTYTYPNNYFYVDYYVRAPSTLKTPNQTMHLYLSHDTYILGNDRSNGYRVTNTSGDFVGCFRQLPADASTHGFKVKDTFRSYYTAHYSPRNNVGADIKLTNSIDASLHDNGIAVEFTIGPFTSAGQTLARQVMHGYGNNKGEFDNTPVNDPTVSGTTSTPVTVALTSATYTEAEGNADHPASAVKLRVSGGVLGQAQVCNFTLANGTASQGTHFTYVKGFTIPAGNYTTPQELTLNNITIKGNTTACDPSHTFKVTIDPPGNCNDLIIRSTTNYEATATIVDDEPRGEITTALPILTYYPGQTVPAIAFALTPSGTTVAWTNSNTSIGLVASGNGNMPQFTAANNTTTAITATITATPTYGCAGMPKTFTITVQPKPTITYHYNGGNAPGTANPANYTYGPAVTISNEPTRTGYTFAGWTCPELSITTPAKPFVIPANETKSLNLYADWGSGPNSYTIDYHLDGGTVTGGTNPTTYDIMTPSFSLRNPVRPGYTFAGWSGTGLTGTANMTVTISGTTGNRTYTAHWIENTYTITYNPNNGTPSATANKGTYKISEVPFAINTMAPANQPVRTGYTFTGWTGQDVTTATKTINVTTNSFSTPGEPENLSYMANWTLVNYTIDYTLNGGAAANPANYDIETTAFTLANPIRSGYTFAGWTGTGLGGATMTVSIPKGSTGNRSYTATWTAINYTLTYMDDDGSTLITVPGAPTQFNDTELPKAFTGTPAKPGWTFTGWTGGAGSNGTPSIVIPGGTHANQTYLANWSANAYTITFNPNSGTNPAIPSAWTGYDMTVLPLNGVSVTPIRMGYTFNGWTGHGLTNQTAPFNITSATTGVPGNLTYTAQWLLDTYNLIYNYHGGSATNPATYNVNSTAITLVNPTYTGYTFAGWTGTDIAGISMLVTVPANSTGHRSYDATWSKNTYTIQYMLNGGTATNPGTYDVETTFTLNNPVKPGYTFAGWTGTDIVGTSMAVSIPLGSVGDRSYTATWAAVTYNIKYVDDNGSTLITAPGAPSTYNDTQLPKAFTSTPVKPGYTFTGWSGTGASGNSVTIPAGTLGDLTYRANWTADPYTITFNANGGANPAIPSNWNGYDMPGLPINGISVTPTRTGYTFNGWTGHGIANQKTPFNITNSTTGVPGNLTYTAQWLLDTYNLAYTLNGGSATNPATYNVTILPITLNNPTQTGYTFAGWTGTDIIGTSMTVTIPAGSTGNRSYTATWTVDGYPVTYNLGGGTPVSPNPLSYTILTPAFTLNNPEQPGYTFAGWSGTGILGTSMSVTVPTGQTGPRTYTAHWTPVTYPINYTLDGGSATNPANYTIETLDFSLSAPVKPGYTFAGWTGSNGTTPQPNVTVYQGTMGILNYTANWSANAYSITFNPASGVNPAIPANWQGYDMTDLPINGINAVPTRLGYTFKGWTGHGLPGTAVPFNITTAMPGVPGNLNFTASWMLDMYSITYRPNGGITVPGNPSSYDVTALPVNIATEPVHLNPENIFIGWTCQQLPSVPMQLVFNIPANTTGNLDMDAHWTKSLNNLNPSGVNDTLFVCEGPKRLYGDPQGKSWEWIFPDGSRQTSRDVNATLSGRYVCHTNYGTKIVPDTMNVYLLMENNSSSISYITVTGAKIGKPQQFVLDIPSPMLPYTTASWSVSGGGVITNASADSLTVVWSSTGEKTVSVQLGFNYGGIVCTKTLATKLQISVRSLGFFVDQTATSGTKDGSSWANAHLTIQDALNVATIGDRIWVAKGTYRPVNGKSFEILQDSIEVYGGFEGTEEYLYERDIVKNPTILYGNGSSIFTVKNSFNTRIDGFTIEGGRADKGAGILFESGSAGTVANCIIRGNSSASRGGGIHTSAPWYGYPASLIVNTEISGNQAAEGAGIYNDGDDIRILNATISGNKAQTAGGLYNYAGSPDISNTIIWGNQATKGNDLTKDIVNNEGSPIYTHSIVGGSKNSEGKWNSTIGRDSTHNKDVSPLFRYSGFEKDGVTMRNGNYQLSSSSAAVDAGSNQAASRGVYVPWDVLLEYPKHSAIEGLVFDLDNNERINNDRVDMGAYEFGAGKMNVMIFRTVHLPEVEGLITVPGPGIHTVESHRDFVFTVTAKPGYSLNWLSISTGIPSRDKEGIKMQKNADGSVTVTIRKVWEPLDVSINGASPVSNSIIENHKIWAYRQNLHIKAQYETMIQIYTLDGKLHIQRMIELGETTIPLPQGLYTIVLDGRVYKVMISD